MINSPLDFSKNKSLSGVSHMSQFQFAPILISLALFFFHMQSKAEEGLTSSVDGSNSEKSDSFKEKWGMTPSFRLGFWEKDKSFSNNRNYSMSSFWLTLHPQEFESIPIHFEGFIQSQQESKINLTNSSFKKEQNIYSEIREWYWQKSISNLDFKIGRQIIVWGRADKINPTDVFTMKNMKVLTSDDEEQRLGLLSAMLTYHWESSKLVALWQPEWRFPAYPMRPVPGIQIHEKSPHNANTQFGLKWDYSGEGFDGSLNYFKGISKTPDIGLSLEPSLLPNTINLDLAYHEMQMMGGDFAFNANNTAFRGEIAYTQNGDKKGDNPFIQNPQLFVVVGADRTIIENLNINMQFLYKHIYHFTEYQDPQLQALIDIENRISQQQFENDYGWSFRPSYQLLNETLELETSFLYWEKNKESVVRPKITYSLNDNAKLMIGGEFFHGPANSLLGSFRDISGGFMEWRYYF